MPDQNFEQNNQSEVFIDISKLEKLLTNFNDSQFELQEDLFDLDNDGKQDEHEKILMENLDSIDEKEVKISLLQELINQLNPNEGLCKTINTKDYLLLSTNISKSSKLTPKYKKDFSNMLKVSAKVLNEIRKENNIDLFEETKTQYDQITNLMKKISSDSEINEEEINYLFLEFNDLMVIADDEGIKINGWKYNIKHPKKSHKRREVKNNAEDLYEKDIEDYSVDEAKAALNYTQNNYAELTHRTTFSWGSDTLEDLDGTSDVHRFQDRLINKILSGNLEQEAQYNNEYIKGFNIKKGGNYLVRIKDFEESELDKELDDINALALKNYFSYLDEEGDLNWLKKDLTDKIKKYKGKNNNILNTQEKLNSYEIDPNEAKEIQGILNMSDIYKVIQGKNEEFFNKNPHYIMGIRDKSFLEKVINKLDKKIEINDINKTLQIEFIKHKKIIIKESDINNIISSINNDFLSTHGFSADTAEEMERNKNNGIEALDSLIKKFKNSPEKINLALLKMLDLGSTVEEKVLERLVKENDLKNIPESVKVYIGKNKQIFDGYSKINKDFLGELYNDFRKENKNENDFVEYIKNSDLKTRIKITNFIIQNKDDYTANLYLLQLLEKGYLGEGNQFLYLPNKSLKVSKLIINIDISYIKYIPKIHLKNEKFIKLAVKNTTKIDDILGYIDTNNINNILLLINLYLEGKIKIKQNLLDPKSIITISNSLEYSSKYSIKIEYKYREEYKLLKKILRENIGMTKELQATSIQYSENLTSNSFKEKAEKEIIENLNLGELGIDISFKQEKIETWTERIYLELRKKFGEGKEADEKIEKTLSIIARNLKETKIKEKNEINKKINQKAKKVKIEKIKSTELRSQNIETGKEELNTEKLKELFLKEIKPGISQEEIEKTKITFIDKNFTNISEEERINILSILSDIEIDKKLSKDVEKLEKIEKHTDIFIKYIESGSEQDFEEYFDEEIKKKEEDEEQEKEEKQNEKTETGENQNIAPEEIYQNYKKEFNGKSDFNKFEESISTEEKKLIGKNPETAKNLINFYNFFKKLNLLSVWKYRNELIKTIGIREINNKDDSLRKEELRKFGNKLLTIIANIGKQEGESKEKIDISTLSGVNERLRKFSGANSTLSDKKTYNIEGEDKFASYLRDYGIIGGAYFHTNKLRKSL